MSLTRPLRIVIASAASMAALLGLVAYENYARAAGTEVLLAIEPVDPRSVLSGHYVIVGLNETLAPGAACPEGIPAAQDLFSIWETDPERWIALSATNGHHLATGAAQSREAAAGLGEHVVRGKAACASAAPFIETIEDGDDLPTRVMLDLGVDRFHIDQDQAERIDELMRDQTRGQPNVFAIVSIGRDGKARLKGIEVEGQRLELNLL
jgi:hypothetical protein